MSLNNTPSGNRIQITLLGKRNAGKSSVMNAITNQEIAIVSDTLGTTTDPVYKAMELLPLGPVLFADTPGLDDVGSLGQQRVEKAKQVLRKTDIGILVVDSSNEIDHVEKSILEDMKNRKIVGIIVFNKIDLIKDTSNIPKEIMGFQTVCVSAKNNSGIEQLKEKLLSIKPENIQPQLLEGLVSNNDFIVLVVPIDSSAPKGRLILPQQQTIREILDFKGISIVCQDTELEYTLKELPKNPKLVITDSQIFSKVNKIVPDGIPLTSFSILFARQKGELSVFYEGISAIESLKDNDTILIAEGCTHHRQCEDIGTVKIPKWLLEKTKKNLKFEFVSGIQFPQDIEKYSIIVHCGGCMLNQNEVKYRMYLAKEKGIPIVNYGILISYLHGTLERSLQIFKI